MSTYTKITRHPVTGEFARATWHDDYFMPHEYGVQFPDDPKIYPADLVQRQKLDHFWSEDVIAALQAFFVDEINVVVVLNEINKAYKARWERDPIYGEGATLPEEIEE